jgi:Mg-chelatase subunit ChlD
MSKAIRPWAVWRRMQYGFGFVLFWILVMVPVYFVFFYQPMSCFDGVKNGDETGVDCGGSCVRICAAEVMPPRIVWSESFEITPGQYNTVAYIENSNQIAGTPALAYTFELLNGSEVVAVRSGTTILPPNSVYPIFEGRIQTTGGVTVTDTRITLEPAELWLPASVGRDQFRTLDIELTGADNRPRLNAKIENTELILARDVEVVATIFNRAGQPLTASQTYIPNFNARSVQDITFTWPNSIARTVRSCEVPSDVIMVLDRSGSMAADGGDPPEPLESAKQAAKSFTRLLQPSDQLGYFSYATTPSEPMEQVLTGNMQMVQDAIQSTTMGSDGVQYTNMGEAFKIALKELQSERARDDTRKVIVFLTDGDVTRPLNPVTGERDIDYAGQYALDAAMQAKNNNVLIYTIGFGDLFLQIEGVLERDIALIRNLASDAEKYYEAPTIRDLQAVYAEIAEDICEEGQAKIDVIAKTPTNFAPLR